jgi:hypothetical protein
MAMRWLEACVMALVVLGLSGCGKAAVDKLNVNVRYTPKSQVKAEALSWVRPEITVGLAAVADERADKTRIGENIEETPPVSVYENPAGSATSAVQDAMQQELQKLGVRLAAPGEAERVLQVTLVHFWVSEDNTYNAECRMRVRVVDRAGTELATILVSGNGKRFGKSLSEENYLEALSSAFVESFENLIKNPQFQQAMGTEPAAGVPAALDAEPPASETAPPTE